MFVCDSAGLKYDPQNAILLQGRQEITASVLSFMQSQGDIPMDIDPQQSSSSSSSFSRSSQPSKPAGPQKPAEPRVEDMNEEERKKYFAKTEKELGNAAYKKKDFDTALKHYNAAIEHDPTDITFHNNIAAVYFERKEYDECIKQCEKGIEIGRENRADFKLIAKSLARIGNTYRKLENYKQAKFYYEKAMSEHRTPEIKTSLSEVEAKIKEEERRAYIDPAKAEEEKEKGNEYFKKGDYSNAVKHYTEAIKRNPDDPKLYSNRAACYTKLAAFDLGLKDCETCIKLDEKFIKGYIRKGKILQVSNRTYEDYSQHKANLNFVFCRECNRLQRLPRLTRRLLNWMRIMLKQLKVIVSAQWTSNAILKKCSKTPCQIQKFNKFLRIRPCVWYSNRCRTIQMRSKSKFIKIIVEYDQYIF